jgi:c-di-GMP-binding flagellar brake protein YcgR
VLEPINEPDFVAMIEAQDRLRVEFFHEGRIHYFDVQVGDVSASSGGVGFSAKLPENVRAKPNREMLQLPATSDEKINMSIGGQPVDVIDVSGGGASVLLPQANLYDVEVGKAIKHIELKVDGFQTKVNAEVRHMRSHADGLKLLVGLRFIFFRNHEEDDLLHLVKQKIASVSRQL